MANTMHSDGDSLADLLRDSSRPRRAGRLLGRLVGGPRWGERIARLMRGPMRARRLATAVTRAHARLLRLSGGRLRRSLVFAAGQPVIVLSTIGRHSGNRRATPVVAFTCDGKLATVGMNLGMQRDPGWSYNLQANAEAWMTIGGETIPVAARLSSDEERERLWKRWTELQPSAETFAKLAERAPPIFVLERRAEQESAQRPPADDTSLPDDTSRQ